MAMDFDQSFSGPVDWNFPSPNATPTHQIYNNDVFSTPKTANLPTHFQDAFTTPQMATISTPNQYPRTDISQQPLPQNQYHGAPAPQAVSPNIHWQNISPSQAQMGHSFDSTQIQTPPPTRDSEVWKQQQQQSQVAFGTPSRIAARRFVTPQRPEQYDVQFGMQFPNIDTAQIMNTGPATAPVHSSSINFWDSLASPVGMRHATLDDPFMHKRVDSNWSMDQTLIPSTIAEQNTLPSSAPMLDQSLLSGSVNPSLVYSSPISAMARTNPVRNRAPLPDTRDARHARLASASSEKLFTSRPTASLRRSNTTGSSNKALPLSASVDMVDRLQQQPRTASPLKRIGRTPLGSISESAKQRRTPVILTVDESGTARTEKIQGENTDSMRARYPGLYDSDSSDSESNSSHPSSRRASFSFSRREDRAQKALKLDPPIENFEKLSIPRSSSSASGRVVTPSRAAVAAAAQLRRQGSLRRTNSGRHSSFPRKAAPIDSHPMTFDDDPDWSSNAAERQIEHDLQQNTSSRRLRSSVTLQNTLDAHNRRWSMMSMEHQQPEHSQIAMSMQQPHVRSMSCVCGTLDDHGSSVVQCVLCTRWSHSACVGVRAGSSAQAAFTCFLCTRPSSNGGMR